MAEIIISDDLKKQAQKLNIDISLLIEELIRREIAKREVLKIIESEEEKELEKWSVELGRKSKKDSFKKLLSELPSDKKEELLRLIPLEKRKEYE